MSKGAYINEEGKLVVDMAEADKLWSSLSKNQQFDAMSAMFDPLLERAKELSAKVEAQAARIRELEQALSNIDDLNQTQPDENDHTWAVSDLINQEIVATRSALTPAPVTDEAAFDRVWKLVREWDISTERGAHRLYQGINGDHVRAILAAAFGTPPAPVTVQEAARVLLAEWEEGEGLLGELCCYSLDEEGMISPDVDGDWVPFSNVHSALSALAGQGGEA